MPKQTSRANHATPLDFRSKYSKSFLNDSRFCMSCTSISSANSSSIRANKVTLATESQAATVAGLACAICAAESAGSTAEKQRSRRILVSAIGQLQHLLKGFAAPGGKQSTRDAPWQGEFVPENFRE